MTEAGLLDAATAIFSDDPELLAAFNEVQAGGTWRTVAQMSDDGVTWTELPDFTFPSGNDWANQVASDGEHLVAVEQTWGDQGLTAITVATTTDLTTWEVTEIPLPADDTPDFVARDMFAGSLAIGADGWYVTVNQSSWVDLWSLVPDEVHEEIGDQAYGFEAGPNGVDVVLYDDVWAEDVGAEDFGADVAQDEAFAAEPAWTEPTVLMTIPWDELPLTWEEYEEFQFGQFDIVGWFGGFDGSLAQAGVPGSTTECCQVIGTDGGFLAQAWADPDNSLFFSTDGAEWVPVALPEGVEWANSIAAVDDGIVIVDESNTVWRGDADGGDWQAVEIPGLPDGAFLWFGSTSGRGGRDRRRCVDPRVGTRRVRRLRGGVRARRLRDRDHRGPGRVRIRAHHRDRDRRCSSRRIHRGHRRR